MSSGSRSVPSTRCPKPIITRWVTALQCEWAWWPDAPVWSRHKILHLRLEEMWPAGEGSLSFPSFCDFQRHRAEGSKGERGSGGRGIAQAFFDLLQVKLFWPRQSRSKKEARIQSTRVFHDCRKYCHKSAPFLFWKCAHLTYNLSWHLLLKPDDHKLLIILYTSVRKALAI